MVIFHSFVYAYQRVPCIHKIGGNSLISQNLGTRQDPRNVVLDKYG